MASLPRTAINTSPTGQYYPDQKKVALDLSPETRGEKKCLHPRTKHAFLILCYTQLALLGFAEGIVSIEIFQPDAKSLFNSRLSLRKLVLDMSWLKILLWAGFTAFDVVSSCLTALEARKLHNVKAVKAVAPLRMWWVVGQMAIALIWVHGGVAWAVLKGPFGSYWGDGPYKVDFGCDVVVPLALTVTFFFTFAWNMSRYCELSDRQVMDEDSNAEGAEYEITL